VGHEVLGFSADSLMPRSRLWYGLHYRTGFRFLRAKVQSALQKAVGKEKFDILWVNSGEYTGPDTIKWAKSRGMRVVSYNNDDPFGGRDGMKWGNYFACLPHYDLTVVMRAFNVDEARRKGAKNVLRVFMSCDEVAHAPRQLTPEIKHKWSSEVAFVGTWMPERGPFLAALVQQGLPLSIWGGRWQKAPEWSILAPAWRGGPVIGDDYAYALQCAKVNLGLLSKGNRDLHTQRTAEVPYLRAVLCAEDTTEHRTLFNHAEDAYLFSGLEEAATGLRRLLADEALRGRVAVGGRSKVIAHGLTNEQVVRKILTSVSSSAA
jgi:hypothetical protein